MTVNHDEQLQYTMFKKNNALIKYDNVHTHTRDERSEGINECLKTSSSFKRNE